MKIASNTSVNVRLGAKFLSLLGWAILQNRTTWNLASSFFPLQHLKNWKQSKKNKTNKLGAKFSSWERPKKSNINSPIILRNELKTYIQKLCSVTCDIFIKISCRCGCQEYRKRQAKRTVLKKDGLKFTNLHLCANVYKHLFNRGDVIYLQKPWGIRIFFGGYRKIWFFELNFHEFSKKIVFWIIF